MQPELLRLGPFQVEKLDQSALGDRARWITWVVAFAPAPATRQSPAPTAPPQMKRCPPAHQTRGDNSFEGVRR